jgi:hypothetical protein
VRLLRLDIGDVVAAESTAGTTATFSTGFSGRAAFAAPPPFEQPAVSASGTAEPSLRKVR